MFIAEWGNPVFACLNTHKPSFLPIQTVTIHLGLQTQFVKYCILSPTTTNYALCLCLSNVWFLALMNIKYEEKMTSLCWINLLTRSKFFLHVPWCSMNYKIFTLTPSDFLLKPTKKKCLLSKWCLFVFVFKNMDSGYHPIKVYQV